MNLLNPIGILGGSFDPIHHGHLRSALDVCDALTLDSVHLLPNYMSPHKSVSHANDNHRLTMLKLATENCPQLIIDEQELNTNSACFTVDTLEKLRQLNPNRPLCFLMGMDSLHSFTHWHRWQDILKLCHLVVSERPGWRIPQDGEVAQLLAKHQIKDHQQLHQQLAGGIYLHRAHPLSISSSEIRALCRQQKSCQFLLPDSVSGYIEQHRLYR